MKTKKISKIKYDSSLIERAKELNCLYDIEELLNFEEKVFEDIFYSIIQIIPKGMQYPDDCSTRIIYEGEYYQSNGFRETEWVLSSEIRIHEVTLGSVEVYYTCEKPLSDIGPFLKEEKRLIDTISGRLSQFIIHNNLKHSLIVWKEKIGELTQGSKTEWSIFLEMLKKTDRHLFSIISKKMLNILFFKGVKETKELLVNLGNVSSLSESIETEQNRPSKKQVLEDSFNLADRIFEIASSYLSDEEILTFIRKWIYEDKSGFLMKVLNNPNTSLAEISDAIRKYHHINPVYEENSPLSTSIKVLLISRFFTDQLQFINIAKHYTEIFDFYELTKNMIFPSDSTGKLGGKSAGLLLAKSILNKQPEHQEILADIKMPKTWYITSDGLVNFIYFNNLEDVMDQKYKDIEQVRQEYPQIIQVFKNCQMPPEIINGLSRALDDFGESPIIVRSSSLLEDRMGASFAGKYKSLFIANQGPKQQRLDELIDAIAEVYASTFGPDPIGYRYEQGLLDYNEEMGIMIQEVVGKKHGKYFFPAFAGVAFSHNDFRWSPRIRREDGLIRIVPGLGTRAVDRIGNDYPVIIAPGQPNLRVNQSFEDIVNYSPKSIDVINLESNTFETVPIRELIKEIGDSFPLLNDVFSIQEDHQLRKPVGIGINTKRDNVIVTFENMFQKRNYIQKIHQMLIDLKVTLQLPVDIEFACDEKHIYLLQCRPQSHSGDSSGAIIPQDIDNEKILFTANKYISNGRIPDASSIVYVNPEHYSTLSDLGELKEIGRIIGRLNKILGKKQFILMGPGRWGSRDDIRLGVNVSYSDINNTSLLIEIARRKGNYVPDLSFGTHFFQDLVEASIRYLPLYPDEKGNGFNEEFLRSSVNRLSRLLPEYSHFSDIVKVIDVAKETGGLVLRVLTNADENRAVGLFVEAHTKPLFEKEIAASTQNIASEFSNWRMKMVEAIANGLDRNEFSVKRFYVLSSSVDDTARPNADIDIILHLDGTPQQKKNMQNWLGGWNLCLREIHFQRTGYRIDNFLDVKFITDFDIRYNTVIVQNLNQNIDSYKELSVKLT